MNLVLQKYRVLGKKGEGTFSEVLKVQNLKDGTYWACKKMKQHYDSLEQVNNLREVQALRRLSPHANILELEEVIFDKRSGDLSLMCELMDMNMYELIRGRRQYLPESKIKQYMYQLVKSIEHMHRNGIFHRDVKPENILLRDDVIKLADFGSCRSVYSKQPYTEYISTRWYRAPECLLTDGFYNYKMDIWSVGCVFFEVMSLHPLFPGSNEVDQIAKIHDVLGTPEPSVLAKLRNKTRGVNFNFPPKKGSGIEKLLPHASSGCKELIYLMCAYDPEDRISAKQAIRHPYFKEYRDADKRAAVAAKAQKEKLKATAKEGGGDSTAQASPEPAPSPRQHRKDRKHHKEHKEKNMLRDVAESSAVVSGTDGSGAAGPAAGHASRKPANGHVESGPDTRPPSGSSTISKVTVASLSRVPAFPQQKKKFLYGKRFPKRGKRAMSMSMADGLNGTAPSSSLLPKVHGLQPSTVQPTYPSGSLGNFPKLSNSTLNLTTLAQQYKPKAKPGARSVLGSYQQLPSIDRKDF